MRSSELSISKIRARAVDVPLRQPIVTASGRIPSAPLVLIDAETAGGAVGRSYIFGYSTISLRPLVELLGQIGDMVVGMPLAPAARAREFEDRFRLLGRQGLLGMALSGLDMALWDALARSHDLSVAAMLGGEDRPVPAYASHGMVDPARDAALLEDSIAQGFPAIKIKLGGRSLADDLHVLAGIRAIVGDDVDLMVDYNQSLSVPEAKRRVAALAQYGLLWVEEPVPAEDLSGHAEIRSHSPIGIQTGENWWFPEDAARAIAAGASDFAMLDLMKIGGVTGWLRAAGQCEGASLPVSSHLFIEASAHVLSATPTAHFLEHLDLAGAIMAEPIPVVAGAVSPRGPGFGIEWDEAAIDRHAI